MSIESALAQARVKVKGLMDIRLVEATEAELESLGLEEVSDEEVAAGTGPVTKQDLTRLMAQLETEQKQNLELINLLTKTAMSRCSNGDTILDLKIANGRINKRLKKLRRENRK